MYARVYGHSALFVYESRSRGSNQEEAEKKELLLRLCLAS